MAMQLPNIAALGPKEKLLKEHEMFTKQIQERQDKLESRKGDLDIADRVMKSLDSNIPKSARQFLLSQTAGHLGIDPKAGGFKNSMTMILGLDPDSAAALRGQFSSQLEGAEPGQITEMTKAVLSGSFPINQLLDKVDFRSVGMAADADVEKQKTAQGQGGQPKTAQPFQEGQGAVQSFEGQRTIPAASQQASPMLIGALGLDSTKRYRNNDLWTNGFRTPMEPKEQEKLAESIITRSVGLASTVTEAANIISLIDGKPEVLGPVGSAARGISGTISQIQGFLNIVRPGATIEDPTPEINILANRVGLDVAKRNGIKVTAQNAHRVQSMVLGLAYRMAVANDIPGNRLTNAIIQQNLEQIGRSSDPESFKAVLTDTIASTTREFNDHVQRTTGVNGVDVLARQATNDDILRMARAGEVLPKELGEALLKEATNRQQGRKSYDIVPAGPTLEDEEKTLGGLEMQDKSRKIAKTEQEMQLDRERNERATAAEERAQAREDRMTKSQEASVGLQRESLDFQRKEAATDNARADRAQDRADIREDRLTETTVQNQQLQREQFDYKKIQDQKEAEQRQREAMQSAWMNFAKLIAGLGGSASGSIGGGAGGGGSGQDASAFRLTPLQQRPLPRPVGGN